MSEKPSPQPVKQHDPALSAVGEFTSQRMKCGEVLTDWLLELVIPGDRADALETLQRLAEMAPNFRNLPRTPREAEEFEIPDKAEDLRPLVAQAVAQVVKDGFLPRMIPLDGLRQETAPAVFRAIEMELRPRTVQLSPSDR